MHFKDLQIEDFAGLDPDPHLFEEWKEAKDLERRYAILFFGLIIIFIAALYLITGNLFIPGFLFFLVVPFLISRKANRLSKELGIDARMYADAWKKRASIMKSGR